MKLPTLSSIDARDPRQVSTGPKSWGEAFGDSVWSNDAVINNIEGFNNDQASLAAAYDRKIRQVKDLTGVELDNPSLVATPYEKQLYAQGVTTDMVSGATLSPEIRKAREDYFRSQVEDLAKKDPRVRAVLGTGMDEAANAEKRKVEENAQLAGSAPELGFFGRLTSSLAGGLIGQRHDPMQIGLGAIGGLEASASRSVVANVGRAMLSDAVINSGTEAVLQLATAENKRKAGLETGLVPALQQIGIAGVFGGLFGGMTEGASALVHSLKLKPEAQPAVERVLRGSPERGDVEAVADALGVPVSQEHQGLMSRAWDDHELDGYGLSDNASPDEIAVYEAAMRHAEDPDNFPPPEAVARMLADRRAEKLFPADIVDAARKGDADAIEHVMQDPRFDRPAEVVSEGQKQRITSASDFHNSPEFRAALDEFSSAASASGLPDGWKIKDEIVSFAAESLATNPRPAAMALAEAIIHDERQLYQMQLDNAREPTNVDPADEIPFFGGKQSGEPAPAREPLAGGGQDGSGSVNAQPDARGSGQSDGISADGRSPAEIDAIAPARSAGPLTSEATRLVEEVLGEINRDAPATLEAMIPVYDNQGNVLMVSIDEALTLAEEPALLADVLEACKL